MTSVSTGPLLDRLSQGRVLVVGDIIMDEFIWGKVDRISPEAPVPVVTVKKETQLLGGAANVVNNIRSIGGEVFLAGILGGDARGREILSLLEQKGVKTGGVLIDPRRPTTVKTRIIAHSQQVVRFDRENRDPLSQGYAESLASYVRETIHAVDTVVIADYGKGVVTGPLVETITETSRAQNKMVALDPKMGRFHLYRDVTIATPNSQEASAASGIEILDEDSLRNAGDKLLERFNCEAILITRGEDGMALFERKREAIFVPTTAREVFDVTGAGDTVIGVMALALSVGASFSEAALISNLAAGIVVGKVGTATVSMEELKAALREAKEAMSVKK